MEAIATMLLMKLLGRLVAADAVPVPLANVISIATGKPKLPANEAKTKDEYFLESSDHQREFRVSLPN